MNNLLKILILSIFISGFGDAFAQKNAEALRRYYKKIGWFNKVKVGIDHKSGNSNYTTIESSFRTDYVHPSFESFLAASIEYKKGEKLLANSGFIHLRGKHPLSNFFAVEAFLQKEYDDFILLNDRNLAGAGARILPIDISLDSSGRRFAVYLGIGFMYENEVYATAPITEKNRIRSTNYLNILIEIAENIDLFSTTYYQVNAVELIDYRLFSQSTLKVGIGGNFSLTLETAFMYNNQPVGDVKKFDFEIKHGIAYNFEL
ncbi:MAG: DUF481 domain-containing protein [Bacteroidota bacterium]